MIEDAYAALSLQRHSGLPRMDDLLPFLDLTIVDQEYAADEHSDHHVGILQRK